jgi:nitrate reductase gamma subunit
VIEFFFKFYHLIFNLLKIGFHVFFFRLDDLDLMTQVVCLKSLHIFLKKYYTFFYFFSRLFKVYNLNHEFDEMSSLDTCLISVTSF